eukprot:scaffold100489_cov20-Tisochrysis_lutea.AAC.2
MIYCAVWPRPRTVKCCAVQSSSPRDSARCRGRCWALCRELKLFAASPCPCKAENPAHAPQGAVAHLQRVEIQELKLYVGTDTRKKALELSLIGTLTLRH